MADGVNTEALRALSPQPSAMVLINGKEIACTPLQPADFVDAVEFVRIAKQKATLKAFASETGSTSDPHLASLTLSKIACEPIGAGDVMLDYLGQLRLIQLSVQRGGFRSNWEGFIRGLGKDEIGKLFEKIGRLSGLIRDKAEGNGHAADPFPGT